MLHHFIFFRVLEFASHSDARKAVRKLDGTTLNGKKIRLIDVSIVSCYIRILLLLKEIKIQCKLIFMYRFRTVQKTGVLDLEAVPGNIKLNIMIKYRFPYVISDEH